MMDIKSFFLFADLYGNNLNRIKSVNVSQDYDQML